ncbi:mitogen-activated protein kinase kinase kinase 19 isoform X2 [Labrus bergylta]
METLSDIRQVYQDTGRGSRGGMSLPSLRDNRRRCSHRDPAPSSGLLSTRTSCLPVPPRHKQRTRSVIPGSPSSPVRLSVPEPSQLSQSAPSIMEPLLCSNTMMQARAHIQTRLGSQNTLQKFSQSILPTLHPRTPKLLAPLGSRCRDVTTLSGLKSHVPLKPISQSPLCSRTHLRRERLGFTKGGSEESGSSSSISSQSSIDLEDYEVEDKNDLTERASVESHLEFLGGRLLQHSNNVSSCEADLVGKTRQRFKVQQRSSDIPPIHKSAPDLDGEAINQTSYLIGARKDVNCYCGDDANHVNCATESIEGQTFKKCNYAQQGGIMNATKDSVIIHGTTYKNESMMVSDSQVNNKNDLHIKRTERTLQDLHYKETLVDNLIPCREDVKLDLKTAEDETQHCKPAGHVDAQRKDWMFKVLKHVQNKERTVVNCEVEANVQINPKSFKMLLQENRINPNQIKTKGKLKNSSLSTHAIAKTGQIHEPIISRERVAKVKSKLNCMKSPHCKTVIPAQRNKVTYHSHSKRGTLDKKGSSRSKSAVDFLTYKDMFQQIQSGDKGPAIYEMFASPVYENLRVSSSCEKVKDRPVQSAPTRKKNKVKQRPFKQAQTKLRRSPAESTMVSAKSKTKVATPRVKPHPTPVSRKGANKMDVLNGYSEAGLLPHKEDDSCHDTSQEKVKLSTIEEDLSRYGSDTLKFIEKKTPASSSHAREQRFMQEKNGMSSKGNSNQSVSESSLSLQQPKINTWTSSSSDSKTIMSPVYQKFLDEVGDGPLTDDLLQCLAEELISLDERDVSIDSCPESLEPRKEESNKDGDPVLCTFSKFETVLPGSGSVLDDTITWTKGEVLGRGAYGTVYCGLTSQGRLIAVKQVSLDASDPDAAKREYSRLQGEVDLLKTLQHSNIVGFLGTSLYQHVVSIFMEYIPGGSIASILHRFGPLPERVLALYTHQILEGVTYLHLNRVIHRDLKGNNVMLMPTGVIKLIDFGCARRLSCVNHTASNSGDLLKSVHGTPYWMAPEVINETGYGRKSDIWSVGCTVFEMATGKPPLAHMDKMAALFYIGARRGLMPSLPDGFSDNAKDFVKTSLTSDPKLRPSAEQLLKHPFIPQNGTGVKSWQTQKNGCGHPEGLCGK